MDKKVYQVWQIIWILPIVFALLIAVLAIDCVFLTIQTINTRDTGAIAPLISAIGLTLFFAFVTRLFFDIPATRLELSEDGLLLYGVGYRISTPWYNISAVTWTKRSPRFPTVFELKEPAIMVCSLAEGRSSQRAILEKHWWLPAWLFQTGETFVRIPVPVRLLSQKQKRDGLMNVYLQRYAPHLLTTI